MSHLPRAWAELSAEALIHNIKRIRALSDAKVMAVVKANAYGHKMQWAANTLAPYVDAFAIATLDEGIELRALHANVPITCLSGFYAPEQIEAFKTHQISPVIFNLDQIKWLEQAGHCGVKLWLKIDTGMGRLGIHPIELKGALARLESLGYEVQIMSHFASADTPNSKQNEAQHQSFINACAGLAHTKSFANSAAIINRPQDHYEVVRPGIMLYGSSPFAGQSAQVLGLKPVMAVYARLMQIKRLNAGEPVGYGASWLAEKNCQIGIVSMGYGDGYPRVVSNEACVYINEQRCPIIGRVSMDSLAVFLNDAPHEIGHQVELWGEHISVDEVAHWADTIAYELLCKAMPRA